MQLDDSKLISWFIASLLGVVGIFRGVVGLVEVVRNRAEKKAKIEQDLTTRTKALEARIKNLEDANHKVELAQQRILQKFDIHL